MSRVSGNYQIFETRQFQKDLKGLSKAGQPKIAQKLRKLVYPELRAQPRFGRHIKKLRAYQPETWRYRVGSWRFFYEIDDQARTVYMTAAALRGSAY